MFWLAAELAHAVRNRTKVRFALYFSLFEWFHPLYLKDKANHYSTQEYVDVSTTMKFIFTYFSLHIPHCTQLLWNLLSLHRNLKVKLILLFFTFLLKS